MYMYTYFNLIHVLFLTSLAHVDWRLLKFRHISQYIIKIHLIIHLKYNNYNNNTEFIFLGSVLPSNQFQFVTVVTLNTIQLLIGRLIGTASHPDVQKIRIIGFFFENRLQWLFEVRLLLCTVCTAV
jgi:hypothetical protein